MAYPLSLTTTAALAIAGIGLGVHLGRDSIAQINPSFYDNSPSSTFYASLVPNAPSFEAGAIMPPQHPDAIVVDESGSCASCYHGQAVYMADGSGYDQSYAEWSEAAPARATAATVAYLEPLAERDPAVAQVERYASYTAAADHEVAAVEEELAYTEPE